MTHERVDTVDLRGGQFEKEIGFAFVDEQIDLDEGVHGEVIPRYRDRLFGCRQQVEDEEETGGAEGEAPLVEG